MPHHVNYPMDTGQSWLIFLCSFLINFLSMGQLLSFGIYFVTFSDYFQIDQKTTSSIGAACFAVTTLVGPVAGVMQKRYGARIVIMTGAALSTTGMVSSYFAKDFWHLYISYGLLVGLGYGFALSPSISVLPEYFEKRRYLVTTLQSVGASLGTLTLTPFTLLMIETYAWQGSMIINACMCMQFFVLGSLVKSRLRDRHASVGTLLNISIFKDYRFVLVLIDSMMLCGSGFVIFSTIASFAMHRGLTIWQSATLVSLMSLSTTAARVSAALWNTFKCVDRLILHCFASLIACVGVISCVFSHDFWTFAASLIVFGFSFGVKISQLVNVLIDLVGIHAIAVANGYLMFAVGSGGFTIPLVAGWIADQSGTEKAYFFILVTLFIGFICCCTILALRQKRMKETETVAVISGDIS